MNPDEFQQAMLHKQGMLVDVRTPEEYQEKHLADSRNIDYEGHDFSKQMGELSKTTPLYLYCLSGGRSKNAAAWATRNGFTEVYNLQHGIDSWIADNKPIETSALAVAEGLSFDDYLNHIKRSDKLILVDFNAVWCGPCKMLKPTVVKVVEKNKDKVELFDIDVDHNPQVARTMNIQSIPLLILYKNGKEVWRNLGLTDGGTIQENINKFSK
jgi:thioredoxin